MKMIKLVNERITNEEIDNKIKEFVGYLKGKNRLGWKPKGLNSGGGCI